jgi:alkylated DNA repair dioxygenase AlkB
MFRQPSLFGTCDPNLDVEFAGVERVDLDDVSWVEHAPAWLTGADAVFDALLERVEFTQRKNIPMYDSLVDEPRLSSWWHDDGVHPEPTPLLASIRERLTQRYHRPFDSIGLNLYRDRNDSVAWHGDRHRKVVTDPIVAIVSVGSRRPLKIRPRGGGSSMSWNLGDGDLFVMGGACQHLWEHAVPKVRRVVGPRMSITYRHDAR